MPIRRSRAACFFAAVLVGFSTTSQTAVGGERPSMRAFAQGNTGPDGWSGPYAGVGFGMRWTNAVWSTTCLQPSLSNCSPPWDGFPNRFANDNPAPFDMKGTRISGYAGYNWQISNWVAGVEADIGWGHDKKNHRGIPGTWDPLLGPGRDATTVTAANWDGSVRGRLGILAGPELLIYTTAGFAWLQTTASASCDGTFPIGWCVNPNSESVTKFLPGWTVGAGVEGRISRQLVLRAEYRYSEYQDFKTTFFETMPVESFNMELRQRTHLVYLGISYLFGAH
jgi:outer membrane immunogenic protein